MAASIAFFLQDRGPSHILSGFNIS